MSGTPGNINIKINLTQNVSTVNTMNTCSTIPNVLANNSQVEFSTQQAFLSIKEPIIVDNIMQISDPVIKNGEPVHETKASSNLLMYFINNKKFGSSVKDISQSEKEQLKRQFSELFEESQDPNKISTTLELSQPPIIHAAVDKIHSNESSSIQKHRNFRNEQSSIMRQLEKEELEIEKIKESISQHQQNSKNLQIQQIEARKVLDEIFSDF